MKMIIIYDNELRLIINDKNRFDLTRFCCNRIDIYHRFLSFSLRRIKTHRRLNFTISCASHNNGSLYDIGSKLDAKLRATAT